MQNPGTPPDRSRVNRRIGLVVGAFGVLMVLIVLATSGGGIPAAGTPILNFEATNAQRTIVAEAALSPAPDVRWEPFIRGRGRETHDLTVVAGTIYVATDDGLLILAPAAGTFTPAPGFPAEEAALRVWVNENGDLTAGLADNRITVRRGDVWDAPTLVTFVFPPPNPIPTALLLDRDRYACDPLGVLQTGAGVYWVACESAVVRVAGDSVTRYLGGGLDGLPGEPTGPLAIGADGRLWVALDNGVAALMP
jgi:hypothetical protein